jgi:2-dehydropantoate 2-reductase
LIWNIPFNGLGVAGSAGLEAMTAPHSALRTPHSLGPCLTTDKLLGNSEWAKLVRELMLEVIAVARALGFAVEDALADKQIERTRTMAAYKASTLIDFERGHPLELESLFLEPLRQAERAGVPAPRLTALCAVLKALDERRSTA